MEVANDMFKEDNRCDGVIECIMPGELVGGCLI